MALDDPIAITGQGLVSPAGRGVPAFLEAVRAGRKLIAPLEVGVARGRPPHLAGRIPEPAPSTDDERRDRAASAALLAAAEALASAGIESAGRERTGLTLGTSLGAIERGEAYFRQKAPADPGDLGWLRGFSPIVLTREVAAPLEIGGPLSTFSATCVSSLYALEQACMDLVFERADAMVCGGVDTIGHFTHSGFSSLGALQPTDGGGLILGEAACFAVLERMSSARARGAMLHGLVAGRALRADSSHLTSPDESGSGMIAAIEAALDEAGDAADDIDLVTLSAPAARSYERMYARALPAVFGARHERVRHPGWEPVVGHVLAASGILGIVYACDRLAGSAEVPRGDVLVLSVGFGGQNGATVVRHPDNHRSGRETAA